MSSSALPFSNVSPDDSTGAGTAFSQQASQELDNGIEDLGNNNTSSSSSSQTTHVGGIVPGSNTTTSTTCAGTGIVPSSPPSSGEERKRGCSIHFQRQCCLANPDLQNYIAVYSSPSSSESITPTATFSPVPAAETVAAPVSPQESRAGSLYSVKYSRSKPNNRPAMLHKPRRPGTVPKRDRRHTITTTTTGSGSSSHPMPSIPNASMPALPNTSMPDITTSRPGCQSSEPPPSVDTTKRRTLDFMPWHHRLSTSSTIRAHNHISSPLATLTPDLLVPNHTTSVLTLPQPITTPPRPAEEAHDGLSNNDKVKSNHRHRLPSTSNHVHIVRTSHPRRTSSFMGRLLFLGARRRMRKVSDITGTFVIDPALRMPDGVFKVMKTSTFTGDEEGNDMDGVGNGMLPDMGGVRRANGEVLFPVPKNTGARVKSMGRNSSGIEGAGQQDAVDGNSKWTRKANLQGNRKNLTLKVQNGGINVDVHLVSNSSQQQLAADRERRTTIELFLEPNLSKNEVIRFPLIARLHAPTPRPPFHLIARTCPPPPHPLSSPLTPSKQLPKPKVRFDLSNKHKIISSPLNTPPSPFYLKASASASTIANLKDSTLDAQAHIGAIDNTSYLSIHVPRSFHGPLTLTVLSGNLDAHISLSDALRDRSVVLREDGCTRGYFVGPVAEESQIGRVGEEEKKNHGQLRGDIGCVYDEPVSSARTSTDGPGRGETESAGANTRGPQVNGVAIDRRSTNVSSCSMKSKLRNTERGCPPCSDYGVLSEEDETPREGSGRFNFSNTGAYFTRPPSPTRTLSPSLSLTPGSSSVISKNKVKRKPVTFPADLRVDELDALIQGAPVHCQHSYPPVVDEPMTNMQGRQPGWKVTRSQSVNGRTRVLSEIRPSVCSLRTRNDDEPTPKEEYENRDVKRVDQEVWLGDQIDIIVGAGKICLQYDDEKRSLWTGDAWRKWCWETFRV